MEVTAEKIWIIAPYPSYEDIIPAGRTFWKISSASMAYSRRIVSLLLVCLQGLKYAPKGTI